jgi:hypothetical protein
MYLLPTVSKKQKKLINSFFNGILKPSEGKSMILSRICNPVGLMYGSAHPDPKQNVTDPEHCFLAIEK